MPVFPERGMVLFEIVLLRRKGYGGHRAEVLRSDGVVVVVRRSGGQNLGSLVGRRVLTPPLPRGVAESQKDRSTYAIAYNALNRNRQFQVVKRSTEVALRGNPRGVSSHHVLLRAFGDALFKT